MEVQGYVDVKISALPELITKFRIRRAKKLEDLRLKWIENFKKRKTGILWWRRFYTQEEAEKRYDTETDFWSPRKYHEEDGRLWADQIDRLDDLIKSKESFKEESILISINLSWILFR